MINYMKDIATTEEAVAFFATKTDEQIVLLDTMFRAGIYYSFDCKYRYVYRAQEEHFAAAWCFRFWDENSYMEHGSVWDVPQDRAIQDAIAYILQRRMAHIA